jgi:hypothetical protein
MNSQRIQELLKMNPSLVTEVINICADEARRYTLKHMGVSENFGGITNVEKEIRKLYEGSH